jgi:hypothetical protein
MSFLTKLFGYKRSSNNPAEYEAAKQVAGELREAESYLKEQLSGVTRPKPILSGTIIETRSGSFQDLWLWFVTDQLKDNEPSRIKSFILGNGLNWDGRDTKGDLYYRGWLRQIDDPHDTQRDTHHSSTIQELWVSPSGGDKFEWLVLERRVRLST